MELGVVKSLIQEALDDVDQKLESASSMARDDIMREEDRSQNWIANRWSRLDADTKDLKLYRQALIDGLAAKKNKELPSHLMMAPKASDYE